ncbi:MAG: hypothetical protein PHT54_04360 [Candidatus Nanoarchaeia archaeon]|nr:hypothetical protein [Candidatus Nanoarchaeia archaeon]
MEQTYLPAWKDPTNIFYPFYENNGRKFNWKAYLQSDLGKKHEENNRKGFREQIVSNYNSAIKKEIDKLNATDNLNVKITKATLEKQMYIVQRLKEHEQAIGISPQEIAFYPMADSEILNELAIPDQTVTPVECRVNTGEIEPISKKYNKNVVSWSHDHATVGFTNFSAIDINTMRYDIPVNFRGIKKEVTTSLFGEEIKFNITISPSYITDRLNHNPTAAVSLSYQTFKVDLDGKIEYENAIKNTKVITGVPFRVINDGSKLEYTLTQIDEDLLQKVKIEDGGLRQSIGSLYIKNKIRFINPEIDLYEFYNLPKPKVKEKPVEEENLVEKIKRMETDLLRYKEETEERFRNLSNINLALINENIAKDCPKNKKRGFFKTKIFKKSKTKTEE